MDKGTEKKQTKAGKIAAIMIRSSVSLKPDKRKTLDLLRLRQKHACVILDDTPTATNNFPIYIGLLRP